MSLYLYNLLDLDELQWLASNGYVREQVHPTEPLSILNYTDRAQTKPEIFEQVPTLNHCRGLIYNSDNGYIVARPFAKFWNLGQAGAAKFQWNDRVIVTDKADGSLGILYREPYSGQLSIATRGSFTSDQAIHATQVLRTKYDGWRPNGDIDTLLFEIVFPDNRIVLDYGDTDDLVLLGSVYIEAGGVDSPQTAQVLHDWTGPVTETLFEGAFDEALKLPLNRQNAEGYVIREYGSSRMVKVKQEDYLLLHRAIFGLSTRRIYEAIVGGQTLEAILAPLPDEFHAWAAAVHDELYAAFRKRYFDLSEAFICTRQYAGLEYLADPEAGLPTRDEKKHFASFAKEHDEPWALFAQLDGHDISEKIWKGLEPPAGQLPGSYTPKAV